MTRSNRSFLRIPALALVAMVAVLSAARPLNEQMTLGTGSKLWFDGTSTVRDWTCAAPQVDVVVDAAANATTEVLGGRKAVRAVQLTVPVARLDCNGNRRMNEHMLKALHSEQHAQIAFALSSYELTAGAAGAPASGTLTGTLTLNGQAKPISFPVEFAAAGAALRVQGSYALKMTDWGVAPPTLMLGALKVGEVVTVRFDLLLQH
jgi:polyisoprenoid-binding protein YceI